MPYWQVQAALPDGARMLFGVEAENREAAAARALQAIKDVLVPVDLEVTPIRPPQVRRRP